MKKQKRSKIAINKGSVAFFVVLFFVVGLTLCGVFLPKDFSLFGFLDDAGVSAWYIEYSTEAVTTENEDGTLTTQYAVLSEGNYFLQKDIVEVDPVGDFWDDVYVFVYGESDPVGSFWEDALENFEPSDDVGELALVFLGYKYQTAFISAEEFFESGKADGADDRLTLSFYENFGDEDVAGEIILLGGSQYISISGKIFKIVGDNPYLLFYDVCDEFAEGVYPRPNWLLEEVETESESETDVDVETVE